MLEAWLALTDWLRNIETYTVSMLVNAVGAKHASSNSRLLVISLTGRFSTTPPTPYISSIAKAHISKDGLGPGSAVGQEIGERGDGDLFLPHSPARQFPAQLRSLVSGYQKSTALPPSISSLFFRQQGK